MAEKNHDHIRRLREEANAIRKQEQAKRRRNKMLTQIGIIVGAIIVIGGIVALVVFGPQWFNPRPPFQAASNVSITTTEGEEVTVPIATTERGGVLVGEPTAPVTYTYWYDYSCNHCITYHQQTSQTYKDVIATGQVKIEYVPINYVAPYGAQAGSAILAVVQHQPELFYDINDAIFGIPAQMQSSWTGPDYAAQLPALGVTNEQAIADIEEGTYLRIISDSTREARSGGVAGTPSVAVNGQILPEVPVGQGIFDTAAQNGATFDDAAGDPAATDPAATAPAATDPAATEPAETPAG